MGGVEEGGDPDGSRQLSMCAAPPPPPPLALRLKGALDLGGPDVSVA